MKASMRKLIRAKKAVPIPPGYAPREHSYVEVCDKNDPEVLFEIFRYKTWKKQDDMISDLKLELEKIGYECNEIEIPFVIPITKNGKLVRRILICHIYEDEPHNLGRLRFEGEEVGWDFNLM